MISEQLKKLSSWTKFVGWVTLICGILSAISGIFFFLVGAIPGVITSMLGWKLIEVSKYAKEALEPNNEALEPMLTNLATYFKVYGVLAIISLVFMILGIIVIVISVGSIASGFPMHM